MKAPKQHRLKVTLETASGIIIRPIVLTDASLISAKHRAGLLAPKPGQKVLSVEVAR